jgi:membrane protein
MSTDPWPQRVKQMSRDLALRAEGTVFTDVLTDLRRTRLVEVVYTLSAQAFVALIPLVLVVSAVFAAGSDQVVARQLIERFGLVGAASDAVRVLFRTPGAGSGIYWLGLVITLYSAFAFSRRVARAYTTIWDVDPLPAKQNWKALVWLAVQIVMIVLSSGLRVFAKQHGPGWEVLAVAVLIVGWATTEFFLQQLLTAGQVERSRLLVAASVVAAGRLAVGAWSAIYLPASLGHQSTQYGPIGVVFSFFTWIFVWLGAQFASIMLVAVFTRRPVAEWFKPPQAVG